MEEVHAVQTRGWIGPRLDVAVRTAKVVVAVGRQIHGANDAVGVLLIKEQTPWDCRQQSPEPAHQYATKFA